MNKPEFEVECAELDGLPEVVAGEEADLAALLAGIADE